MNTFVKVMHANTCNCAACASVPTLGIKMPYEEEEKKATKTRKTRQKLIVGENELPKNYKHGNEYESKIMEDLGYKLISLFEEIYNYKATPEIQKLVDFKEFEKWYDIHRKRISAKATDNAAKKAA